MKQARVCPECGEVFESARVCLNHDGARIWTEPTLVGNDVELKRSVFTEGIHVPAPVDDAPTQGYEIDGVWTPCLYTARYVEFRPSWGLPIRTTTGEPKFSLGYELVDHVKAITPYGLFGGPELSDEEYGIQYRSRLEKTGPKKLEYIFRKIGEAHGRRALVLLCYENVRGHEWACHRRFFAAWWQEKTGQVVTELLGPEKPKARKAAAPASGTLF